MKSSTADIASRRVQLAELLKKEGYLSVSELSRRIRVSEATVRRDLGALEEQNQITRTHGGALSEYDTFFSSFYQRKSLNRELKKRIARSAAGLLEDNQRIFLDAGSTVYSVAAEISESSHRDLKIVTNSLPIAEIFVLRGTCEVHLLGGQLLPHQLIVVGPGVGLSLSAWRFDVAIFGAQAMDSNGLWNSQDQIVDFQRHVCGRSSQTVFCVDSTKLGQTGPSFLLRWQEVDRLVTTAPIELLNSKGVILRSDQYVQA